jgi:hypothetical protein
LYLANKQKELTINAIKKTPWEIFLREELVENIYVPNKQRICKTNQLERILWSAWVF